MPSKLQTDIGEHDEIQVLKHKVPVKKSSVQYQAARLPDEKVSSPGENRIVRLQDKGQPLKTTKPTEQTAPDQHTAITGEIGVRNSVPAMPLANRHKPWPSRKVTGREPMVKYMSSVPPVKYMSSVPGYLQQLEKGDIVQDKALNFGVVDWGRLEKWSFLQKQVANRGTGDSPSSSSASSSPFSTSGSSSQSDRSINSSLAQRKQSSSLVTHRNSSVKDPQTRMTGKQSSVLVMTNPDSRTSHDKDSIGHNHEKGKLSSSDVKYMSSDKSPPPDVGNSSCTLKGNDASAISHNIVKAQTGRSREAENLPGCEQQNVQGNLHFAEKELSNQFSVVESMWDRLQESFHERHTSYDSAMNNRRSVEFPPTDIQFTNPPPLISYSCPLSSTNQREELVVASDPLSENKMLTANAKGKQVKLGRFTDDLPMTLVVNMADKSSQAEVKVAVLPRRELSPQRLLRAGLNRIRGSSVREGSSGQQAKQIICSANYHEDSETSNRKGRRSPSPSRMLSAGLNLIRNSSSREGSSEQQMKEKVFSDNSHEDNAASNVRSRHSPLRRIFDTLKSKNQVHFSGPITSLPSHRAQGVSNRENLSIRDELKSANGACKSSDAIVNHSKSQVTEAGCAVLAEKKVTSTRQALLKLAWKNGLPLFVFFSSDINILAATMGKRNISQNNDFECTYTIFTAHEVKKKVGVWMSHVNKNKKHDLVHKVVGQIKVSSSKSTSDDSFSVREFVLYGGEQISTAQNLASSLFRNELAAIVIQVQTGRPENDNCEILQSGIFRDSSLMKSAEDKHSIESLQVEQKNENSSLGSVVAILPSGVHGVSSTGGPSPLIERWKSGGSCDCGGWDEGCMLTILTDKIQERSATSDQACTMDGTYRIELFTQRETKETMHAFSMNAFKEGVYTVDFGASISSLQAFAICIAHLHGKKPTTLSGLHYSLEAQSLEEQTIIQGESPTRCVPDHPPLSPVGRA